MPRPTAAAPTTLLATALLVALLYFDPATPSFAAPKAAALLLIAVLALPWLPRPGLRWGMALGALLLTPLIALDPSVAVWGRPPRAEGVLFLGAMLLLALLARSLGSAEARWLDRSAHLGGALLALGVLIGVFQLSLPGLPPGFDKGHGGTLGNPNTAGAVLAALLVHAAARGDGWRLLMPLYAAALFGTGSRAAWLAMLLGLAWLLPAGLLRRSALGLLGAGALAMFAALSLRAEPAPSAALRVELWGAALRALAPVARAEDPLARVRWLIGYGPEQQAEVLERHRRAQQNAWEDGGHERVADRAHSLPLDLWLSFGMAGLLLCYAMLRRIRHAGASPPAAAALALLGAGLFGFYGPAEWLLLALWLARCQPAEPEATPPQAWRLRLLASLVLGLVALRLGLHAHPAAHEMASRQQLEAEYRELSTRSDTAVALRALSARVCARAAARAQDGEAVLLCAQTALAAGELLQAASAAQRATRLRPARPRAWLLLALADPARAQPALRGLGDTLQHARLDPETRRRWAAALDRAAGQHPAWQTLAEYREVQRLLDASALL